MVDALAHRGPDASGVREFEGGTLGHARLRIIDLSPAGDQPMTNEDGTVWVAFNGELYNFAELRGELERGGHAFRSHTDTEVLVHLYEQHGDSLAERLRGMFAFAIWDDRLDRLLLCRDRLGIKPLYYRQVGRRLDFASEVRALASRDDAVDGAALNSYLRLGWVAGPRTILTGVEELAAGHVLIWERGTVRTRSYWSPASVPADRAPPSHDDLAEALTDATARHVVADVPVGLFLSSGVDSVMVATLAQRVSPGIRAYTVSFDAGLNEGPEAAVLARRIGIDHTVVEISGADVLGSLDRVIADMDQPTVDGVNSWVISRAVREAGMVVALSGLGGDELFGGYSTFGHVPRLVRAGRSARLLPAWARSAPVEAAGRLARTAHWRGTRAVEAAMTGTWEAAYGSVRGLFGARELDAIWHLERSSSSPRLVRMPDARLEGRAMVCGLELGNYLPYQLLRDTDCMSMAHALEVRVPLLDDRVVEVAIAGQRGGGTTWTKSDLVKAVDPQFGFLADRPKQTFTFPFDRWMRGPLRERVLGALAGLGESGLGFDRRRLTDLWLGYQSGTVAWRPIWALAVLGMWLDAHADARPRPARSGAA